MDIQESVVLLLVASCLFMLPYDKVVAISTSNQQPAPFQNSQ